MKEQFIPYEQALKLEILGFNESCFKVYDEQGYIQDEKEMDNLGLKKVKAPLWQQAFDWFREKHNMNAQIRNNDKYYFININKIDYFSKIGESLEVNKPFKTYEESRLECLNKLIELI